MQAELKFDLKDFDDSKRLKIALAAPDLASIVWRLAFENIEEEFHGKGDEYSTQEILSEKIARLLQEYNIDMNDLSYC